MKNVRQEANEDAKTNEALRKEWSAVAVEEVPAIPDGLGGPLSVRVEEVPDNPLSALEGKDGAFVIPAEEIDALSGETEVDIGADMALRIRKFGRAEFFKMAPDRTFNANVLLIKETPDATYQAIRCC